MGFRTFGSLIGTATSTLLLALDVPARGVVAASALAAAAAAMTAFAVSEKPVERGKAKDDSCCGLSASLLPCAGAENWWASPIHPPPA